MRRFILLVMVLIGFAAGPAAAQDTAATPPISREELSAFATQMADQAASARSARDDAQRYAEDASDEVSTLMDTANDLLGLFQNVTAVSGVIIPLLAVLAGVSALSRLNSAQKDLEAAQKKFEADVKEKQEELVKVRQELERATAEQRENATRANLAMSFLSLGERQYRTGDFSGAITTYLQALNLHPDNLLTHYRLGYVYTQSGLLDKAEAHLNQALKIEANFAPALACLGYVTRRIAEKMPAGIERDMTLNRAESLLMQALAFAPKLVDDDGESWWGSLGGLYRRRNQVDEAIYAYERASQVTPKSSYAYSNLALLYVIKQDREAMFRTYQRVEQLALGEVLADVDNYWAYADLLTSRLALGKVKEAEETLVSVLDITPKEGPHVFESLLDTLGRLELALGAENSAHVRHAAEIIRGYRDQLRMQQEAEQAAAASS